MAQVLEQTPPETSERTVSAGADCSPQMRGLTQTSKDLKSDVSGRCQ